MSRARDFVVGVLAGALAPREVLELPEWMERNVRLRVEESIDSPGPYRRDRSVPMGKLFAKFNAGRWRKLVVKKGSQSAFTLHCQGDIAKEVAERPRNMLFVIDSQAEARKFSKKRLGPMLEDCVATAGLYSETEDDQNMLEFSFPGMSLWLFGAGSPGQVASKTAARMYADEVDKYPEFAGEASMLDLLEQRGKEVTGSVLIAGSTPTTEDGQITRAHKEGSRDVYRVPCVHCGTRQVLDIPKPGKSPAPLRLEHCRRKSGQYDLERVLAETWYECEECGGEIRDENKPAMLQAGEWEATNFVVVEGERVPAWTPGVLSGWLNDLYSVHENSTFGQIALQLLGAREDPRKMHNFLNGRMGRELKSEVFSVKPEGVRRLCGPYLRKTMPEVPCVLTMQADNQGSGRVKWLVSGWMPPEFSDEGAILSRLWLPRDASEQLFRELSGESLKRVKGKVQWVASPPNDFGDCVKMGYVLATVMGPELAGGDQYVIDWGEVDSRDKLDEVMSRRYECGGRRLVAQRGIMDEGGEGASGEKEAGTTWEVREWCAQRGALWLPCKGRGDGQINDLTALRPCALVKGGTEAIPVLHFDDDNFKRKLYLDKIARFRAVRKGMEGGNE